MKTQHHVSRPNLLVEGFITAELTNGKHFTYKVAKWKVPGDDTKMIVGLLTGPDNTKDYTFFAFVVPLSKARVQVWKRYCSEAYEKHACLLEGLAEDNVVKWLQSGKCSCCGRMLTNPESIELGIGPKCRGRK